MQLLDKAIGIWKQGFPIPVDLAALLLAKGYDVTALEARHLK